MFRTLICSVSIGFLSGTTALAQLDDTWTVTVGGQTAQVNPDGTFRIANVSAPDLFGPEGPGSANDQVSDDYVRVTGTGLINGVLHWVASEPFRFAQGETYTISSLLFLSSPPPDVAELTVDVNNAILEPGQHTQATATALFNDGSTNDVTLPDTWTAYHTSNPAIVEIDDHGVLTATGGGEAFITASNSGTTATTALRVIPDTVLTTVEGFVQFEDGSGVEDADVFLPFGGESAVTDGDGFFSIGASVAATTTNLRVLAEVLANGEVWEGEARNITPFADGITDAGIITLRLPPCDGQWVDGHFCPPGIFGADRIIGDVFAFTSWDDGTGAALYVGGGFAIAGCSTATSLAKWDGSTWSPLGTELEGYDVVTPPEVYDVALFDDGAGEALYAAGRFEAAGGIVVNNIARWDGAAWSALGEDAALAGDFAHVNALTVFDDGAGPALYAGGAGGFFAPDGTLIQRIAKWDGATWSSLGDGFAASSLEVRALAVFDDGSGPALYAGGVFTSVAGITVNRVVKWDGSTWFALGDGVAAGNVDDLTVFDDGTGPALYAGGFLIFDGVSGFSGVAKWDGAVWMSVSGMNGFVKSLGVFDDGAGEALYAGGFYSPSSGLPASYVVKWHPDSGFSALGAGMNGEVTAFGTFDDGTGDALYLGGRFFIADGVPATRIARWDGSAMAPVPAGSGLTSEVVDMAVFDDGTGAALYAGGFHLTAGNLAEGHITKWDGSVWSPVGAPVENRVTTLAVHDDGTGSVLYASGLFTSVGGTPANHIAKWDGAMWSALGPGVFSALSAMISYDDGTGPALYVASDPVLVGGYTVHQVKKWDGSSWSVLGGMDHPVVDLESFDDGTGTALYAAGFFSMVDGVPANRIARLCGSTWSPVGTGINAGSSFWVQDLAVFDDGTGPALYAGGNFDGAGGVAANHIAKWDGKVWSPLGSGLGEFLGQMPWSLTVFDDGTGGALYAGGEFGTAGGAPALMMAKWDGVAWSPLGTGLSGAIGLAGKARAVVGFDDGTGPALFAGGNFTLAGGQPSTFIAKWQHPQRPCPAP